MYVSEVAQCWLLGTRKLFAGQYVTRDSLEERAHGAPEATLQISTCIPDALENWAHVVALTSNGTCTYILAGATLQMTRDLRFSKYGNSSARDQKLILACSTIVNDQSKIACQPKGNW